jgi:hypothetical protein
MLRQSYSETILLVRLLRRLLAEGVAIADVPAEVARMEASGEIELVKKPHPPTDWWLAALRQSDRLPFEWWLVKLPGGQFSIETDNPDHPLDPSHILSRERLPPPPVAPIVPVETPAAPTVPVSKQPLEVKPVKPVTRREAVIEDYRRLVVEAALWLAPQLKKGSKVDDLKGACMERFPDITLSSYLKRVWPIARILRGLPAQATPGAKPSAEG